MMQLAQYYESTVLDRETDRSVHLLTIPARSLANPSILKEGGDRVSELLDLIIKFESRSPASLQPMLAAMLVAGDDADRADELMSELHKHPSDSQWEVIGEEVAEFAEQIVYAEIVPFEGSPLDLHSLAHIAASAGPAGFGFTVGFAAAAGHPLLLITVPLGIALCVAAPRWGGKLGEVGEVLLDRVVSLIKGKDYEGAPRPRRPLDKIRATVIPGKLKPRGKSKPK